MKGPFDPAPQRVVITQSEMFKLAGSEIVAAEIAEYFSSLGVEVIVVTFGFSAYWQEELERLPGVRIYRWDDSVLNAVLGEAVPTLVWVHHQLVPKQLLQAPAHCRFVFHHMSTTNPLEFALFPTIESALAGAVVFPAQETLDHHLASRLLDGVDHTRLSVFGNPAPDSFRMARARDRDIGERRLLAVSNHIPPELLEAFRVLREMHDVEIVQIGGEAAKGSRAQRVKPADLRHVDAVISIGKTVQYSLVAGIPVYCYDHFGGPGWLVPSNFDLARRSNFSGRGFAQKNSTAIVDELLSGLASLSSLRQFPSPNQAREFTLSAAMSRLAPAIREPVCELSDTDVTAFGLELELRNGLVKAIEAREQTVAHVGTKLAIVEARLHNALESAPAPAIDQPAVRASAAGRARNVLGGWFRRRTEH